MTKNNYNSASAEEPRKRYSPADPTNDINGEFWRELCKRVDEARYALSPQRAEERMARGGNDALSASKIESIIQKVMKEKEK